MMQQPWCEQRRCALTGFISAQLSADAALVNVDPGPWSPVVEQPSWSTKARGIIRSCMCICDGYFVCLGWYDACFVDGKPLHA
jgi:hypothetical protein